MINYYEEYIPIPNGQMGMVIRQRLMSDLLGQTGYEIRGKELIFTRDLTALSPAVNGVDMQLVVLDMSKYSDYELLPINADMEAQVIDTVYKMFAGEPNKPQIVDPTSDTK
jgi:hypothetical protein